MKIDRIDVFQCNTPFKGGYNSPHTLRLRAESIVVQIVFDNGISGYGESTPRTYVTGEDVVSVTYLIQDHFSSTLLGQDICSIEDIKMFLNILEEKCIKKKITSYLSALGAIDIALLDALGKYLDVSPDFFLGPIVNEKISYTLPIPLLPAEVIKEIPRMLAGMEFRSIKVLLGKSASENMERLALIRDIFGARVEINVEANGKWTYQQAVNNLEKLKIFDISAVEQPVAKDDLEGLRKIRKLMGIPVIADESMCSLSDAKALVDKGACDILNIKISKCGGLLKSKEIADFALSRGVRFQLGTHVGETDILNRAGRHFALVCPNIINYEGFSHLLFFNAWDGNSLKQEANNRNFSDNAGLGINLTHQSLKMLHSSLLK